MKVGIGVVEKNGSFLVVKKINNIGSDLWRFPGGKLEDKETFEEGIKREVREETGVKCKPVKQIGSRRWDSKFMKIVFYHCEYIDGDGRIAEPEKFSDIKWMTPEQLFSEIGVEKIKKSVREFILERTKNKLTIKYSGHKEPRC